MIRRIARLLAAAGLLLAVAALPAQAAYRLSQQDRADIARIEAYLNGIDTLKSKFVQLASGGRHAEGTIYIERPDRLRLDYRTPATTQVYANANWLIHIDTEMETVSHVPIGATPAGFLLRDEIRFGGDVAVRRVVRSERTVTVELVNSDEPEQGSFTVTFADGPLRLQKWTVVDAQGVTTSVTLVSPAFNVPVPREVFMFDETKYEQQMP